MERRHHEGHADPGVHLRAVDVEATAPIVVPIEAGSPLQRFGRVTRTVHGRYINWRATSRVAATSYQLTTRGRCFLFASVTTRDVS